MSADAEVAAALAAVRAASELCAGAQGRLADGDTLTKGDESPVTVADFAAQAVVCGTLTDALGAIDLVGEEDSDDLRADARRSLLDSVVDLVRRQRGDDVRTRRRLSHGRQRGVARPAAPRVEHRLDRRRDDRPRPVEAA